MVPTAKNDMQPAAAPTEESLSKDVLLDLYRRLLRIRLVEEKIVELYPQQEMRCPTHLALGQESSAAGVCAALDDDDVALSTHRCHGHYLAKGGGIRELFAELYGKVTGCARGKGGSMHLVDVGKGFLGASAIVGGTIPMSVGLAWSFRLRGLDRVAVAFFGDGGTEQGVFYESMNFAALKKLPVLFVCENNFYATHSPVAARQPLDNIYRRGDPFGIPGQRVEGTDVVAVYQAAVDALAHCRAGKGPTLMEVRCYRWKEHVGPNFDYDWGYRSKEELEDWMHRCPIRLHEDYLLAEGIASTKELEAIRARICREIDEAVVFARQSPFPSPEEVHKDVVYDGNTMR